MTGYMHPGWHGVKPWDGILGDAPPDPREHKHSYRPVPAKPAPGPAPDWTPPPPRPARPVPRWLAAELAGADCVGPGSAWAEED